MHTAARPVRPIPVAPTTSTLRPLGVGAVRIEDGFWGARQELNRRAIIPHAAAWMDRLGWTANLARSRDGAEYPHRGREFADSEVYKLVEAMSWDRARDGSDELDVILDRFLDLVVAAQDPDGYLHTLFGRPWQRPRYSDFQWGHELYCFGHLLQAAVAHHRATGEERLLHVAIRLADHVCTMFGPDGLNRVCGHAEIELGLLELFRVTGEVRYRDQAALFIERRGTGTLPLFEFGRAYWQDDMPVRQADVLRGHAVRALYLAAGAVDVAVETGDRELLDALVRQWDATVARRTYLTGGMGSHHMDEAFGDDFVLPADRSYCETCAGVASIMFSWRLLLATGEPRYADLIERTLYNVVATSPARDGRSFFYANTLHQRVAHAEPALDDDGVAIRGGSAGRQPWFEVSCCPPNLARMLASLGSYVATTTDGGIQLHQYVAGTIRTDAADLRVETDYPFDDRVTIFVEEAREPFELTLRIPAWAEGATVAVDARVLPAAPGWFRLRVDAGDDVRLTLPIRLRQTTADARVDAVRGTVAFERGPLVMALESTDLPEHWHLDAVTVLDDSGIDGAVPSVEVEHRASTTAAWPFDVPAPSAQTERRRVELIPYFDWANRGPATMRIWIPVETTP